MKKNVIITVIMTGLLFVAPANAQVVIGVDNVSVNPNATLQISDDTTTASASTPGVIIPRLSLSELIAKNAAYTASHNGTLVFVKQIDGTGTGKTVDVKSTGFYYYDGSAWKPLAPEAPEENYDNSFKPKPAPKIIAPNTSYNWSSNNTYNFFEIEGTGSINFPPAGDFANRTIYLMNRTSGVVSFTNLSTGIPAGFSLAAYSAVKLYSKNGRWYIMAGRKGS
ncbi:MAG: hypothetical protein LBQ84_07980 [Flavobacteriaceae bacterium]|jgi:hypothetical protein|nr:hypothetical protein [Flavobacteriaceae bacterium]